MRSAYRARWCVALFVTALWVTDTIAQGSVGSVSGRVITIDGDAVSKAHVRVVGTTQTGTTDIQGKFIIADIPSGEYELEFNYRTAIPVRRTVVVNPGSTTTVDQTVEWTVPLAERITIYGASLRDEPSLEAPAAVTGLTERELSDQAAHGQLPRLLEFSTGVSVTQTGLFDFNLNTRGFNDALNSRVETRLDGRDLADPLVRVQEWPALSFPLDDLASVEFVRGPSSTLYGANASNGVLTLRSKEPRYSLGTQLRFSVAERNGVNTDFRWAGELGGGWYVRAMGGSRDSDDLVRSRARSVEYSNLCPVPQGLAVDCLPGEVPPKTDRIKVRFGGIRFDRYVGQSHRLTAEVGTSHLRGQTFLSGESRTQMLETRRPWGRFSWVGPEFNLSASFEAVDRRGLALSPNAPLFQTSDRYQLEAKRDWSTGRGRFKVLLGGFFERVKVDSADPESGQQTAVVRPIDVNRESVFAQLDWRLTSRLKMTAGGRLDDSTLHELRLTPKAALIYELSPNQRLRLTVDEAFRTANLIGFFFRGQVGISDLSFLEDSICAPAGEDCGLGSTPILFVGNETLVPEELRTLELGYTATLANKIYVTADWYHSDIDNFVSQHVVTQLGTPLGQANANFGAWTVDGVSTTTLDAVRSAAAIALDPIGAQLTNDADGSPAIVAASFANLGEVDAQGVDLGITHFISSRWKAQLTYSWFDEDTEESIPGLDALRAPNTPRNKVSFGAEYLGERIHAALRFRWTEEFRWTSGIFQGPVPEYTTASLNANYVINDYWKVGVDVSNLFNNRHWEAFGGSIIPRRALVHATWSQ